jgi:hypothetical protein
LLVDRVIASSQGCSPFQGLFTPILLRIKGEPPPQLSTTRGAPSSSCRRPRQSCSTEPDPCARAAQGRRALHCRAGQEGSNAAPSPHTLFPR